MTRDDDSPSGFAQRSASKGLLGVADDPPQAIMAKRALLSGATAFIAVNLWTGAPLFALWVGSKVVGKQALSMEAVFVVVIVLAVLLYAMTLALAWLSASYDTLTGRPSGELRLTWLRSMNAQGKDVVARSALSTLERIVMASVYIAVISFVAWFFLFAGSPLPG